MSATNIKLRVISLGAGVQSTTMALMAAHGEIGPMPDCAIFADTMAEPKSVYRHLDWLESQLPFPVHRVSAGSLHEEIIEAMKGGGRRMDGRPPFFTGGTTAGMLTRQCTSHYKINPIIKEVRRLLGLGHGQRAPRTIVVEQWIGISTDEASRIKPSRLPYIEHIWPLIDVGMSRADCLKWNDRHGYPEPPKSACTFCPFHSNSVWRALRNGDPDDWAAAVEIDEAIRPGMPGPNRPPGDSWWVHPERIPLTEVDLSTEAERGQLNMFLNECEGMCGV